MLSFQFVLLNGGLNKNKKGFRQLATLRTTHNRHINLEHVHNLNPKSVVDQNMSCFCSKHN